LVYFLTAVVMMGVAQLIRDGSRARETFLFSRLGARTERFFCSAVTLSAIALCTSALYQSVIMFFNTCRMDVSGDPAASACLFIPHAIIPVGFLLFDLQLIAIFFRTITTPGRTPLQHRD
jgi:TRAP-type C4-dicarboxylate transport system permease small subunit